jgi:prevent-host-death family protein
VSELKSRLSAYLAEVRKGATIIVYDRNTPIARLTPLVEAEDDLVITKAAQRASNLKKIKGVRPKRPVDVDRLLQELRKDR